MCSSAVAAQCTTTPFASAARRELFEVIGQMRQRVFLDPRRQFAQRFPFGDAVRLRIALLAQVPQALVVKRDVLRLRDETRPPLSRDRSGSFACSVQDLRDMDEARVELSSVPRSLAGASGTTCRPTRYIPRPHSDDRGPCPAPCAPTPASSVTEKVPPKPQHSSGRAGLTNSMPLTPSSKARGFENGVPATSEIDASFRCRNALQLLCRPTRCGNSAHGNSRALDHVMQEFDQFVRARRAPCCTSAVCSIAVKCSRT